MLLALRLTAIVLLLRPMGPWGVRPLILILAVAALLSPRVLGSQVTWFALTALLAIRLLVDWPLPDNHVFLLTYWCFAVALVLLGLLMLVMGLLSHVDFQRQLRSERRDLESQHLVHGDLSFPVSRTFIVAVLLTVPGVLAIVGMILRAGPLR